MPSWRELERFCRRDGWEEYNRKSHHIYFRKVLDDGQVLRTKVSRGTGEIPKNQWKKILKQQLQVSEEYFNRKK